MMASSIKMAALCAAAALAAIAAPASNGSALGAQTSLPRPYTCGCQPIAPRDCPCTHSTPDPFCSERNHSLMLLRNDFDCENSTTCNNQDEGSPDHKPLHFSSDQIVFPGNAGTNFSGIHYRPAGDFCGSLKLRGDVYARMELKSSSAGRFLPTMGRGSVPPSVGYLVNRDTGWLTVFGWWEQPDTNQTVVGLELCQFPGDKCHRRRSWWVPGGLPTHYYALSQMRKFEHGGQIDTVLNADGTVQYGCDSRNCSTISPITWESSTSQETYANYDISVQSGSDVTLLDFELSRQFVPPQAVYHPVKTDDCM